MAVIEYDSYKQKLLAMDETLENLCKALEIEPARMELKRLELEAHEDGFWNDLERSQKNQVRSKQLHNKIHRYEKLVSTRDDLLALIDMGSDFRINLYRKKADVDQNGVIDPKERDTNDTKVEPNDTNEEALLSIILKNPQATQGAIAKEVGASLSTVKRIMRNLQKSGKLRREGTNRNGSWVVTGQKE